jgi:nucleotide-binding universal stress UspA family protein
MYKKILIPLDRSAGDTKIIEHVIPLAHLCQASLTLVHVADGFVARHQDRMNLHDSPEILSDQKYLEECALQVQKTGVECFHFIERGDPTQKLLEVIEREKIDLITMATHGHGAVLDIILGSVADELRHRTTIPILMLRG